MNEKKKRGSNYTVAERKILLELIKKHEDIIDNKDTSGIWISKKRAAWQSVAQDYNTVAVSGVRTWQNLRHFYENTKQKAKKKIVEIDVDPVIVRLDTPETDKSLPDWDPCIVTPNITISEPQQQHSLEDIDIQQEYLRTKLRNAKLEQIYIKNKNKMEINKYKMEMEILKLKLKRLQHEKHL